MVRYNALIQERMPRAGKNGDIFPMRETSRLSDIPPIFSPSGVDLPEGLASKMLDASSQCGKSLSAPYFGKITISAIANLCTFSSVLSVGEIGCNAQFRLRNFSLCT